MSSTKSVKIDPLNINEDYIVEAAQILKNGGLALIPTETVYGIAADASNKKTLQRLSEIKKRPKDKPFSLHIDEKLKIEEFCREIPVFAYKLIDKFWPGPLTLVLKSKSNSTIGISTLLSANGERSRTIGLRMPDNEIALKVISRAEVPVVCPSANISAEPAPINFAQAIKDLDGLVDFAIDAGSTKIKKESTVVDATRESLSILREGALKKEALELAANKKVILFICTGNSCRSVMAKGLLEKKLKEQGRQDVEVLSAGIMMLSGLGATQETRELLKKEGMDVSSHRSQRVTPEMVKKSDLILVMEGLQEERIRQLVPEAKNRLFLLKEFANPVRNRNFINLAKISNGTKIGSNELDITDPIGKSADFYNQTFVTIKEAIERISEII